MEFNADEAVTFWRAAAWTAGGTAAIILHDANDEAARQIVEKLIAEVEIDPKYGIERVYRRQEITELHGFSNADFVLALAPGFEFGRKLRGPVFVEHAGGTHGYLPVVEDMDAAFFIVGPGIAHGQSLGRIDSATSRRLWLHFYHSSFREPKAEMSWRCDDQRTANNDSVSRRQTRSKRACHGPSAIRH